MGVAIAGGTFLVTGGTGFLGTWLAAELVRRGARARVLDRRAPAGEASPAVEVEIGDVRDRDAVERACRGVEAVFHCAALPSIARGSPEAYRRINVDGTQLVASAARLGGAKKLVYVSSSTVYGVPRRVPLRETDRAAPQGPYSRTKLIAERICAGAEGLATTVIRPRVILGPGRLGIFEVLFRRVARGLAVFTLGPGTNRFQFTHVRDVVSACLLAVESDETGVFNVGCRDVRPVREELETLVRHAGSRSRTWPLPAGPCRLALRLLDLAGLAPLVREQFSIADRDFVLDTTRVQERLGWRPTASNVDCLVEAYDWFLAHAKQAASGGGLLERLRSDRQGGFQR